MEAILLIGLVILMILCAMFSIACNETMERDYNMKPISYLWAGITAIFLLATISEFGQKTDERFAYLVIIVLLTIFAVRRCKKKIWSVCKDKKISWLCMIGQAVAPVGILGVLIIIGLIFSRNDKKKSEK